MDALKRWMEITFVLIIIYLVLSRGSAFSQVVRALSSAYGTSVMRLQGR